MITRPGLEQIDPGRVADGTYTLVVAGGTIVGLTSASTSPPTLSPLMQDGVSTATPIETEAGDDWLYPD